MSRVLVVLVALLTGVALAPPAHAAAPEISWVTFPDAVVTTTDAVSFAWDSPGATLNWYYLDKKNVSDQWQSHTGSYPSGTAFSTALPDGDYRLRVYASNVDGGSELIGYFSVDAVPEATVLMPAVTASGPVSFSLVNTPSAAGNEIESYDVRYVEWTWMSPGASPTYVYPEEWQATTSTELTLPNPPRGKFVCMSVRAREVGGATGPWDSARCTSTALDDRAFTRLANAKGSTTNHQWVRGTGSDYTFNRFTRTKVKGHTATTDRIIPWYKSPVLVATTCPSCGRVSVQQTASDHSEELGTYSLVSDVRTNQALIQVQASIDGGFDYGRLKVTVASRDKLVLLDGVAVLPPDAFLPAD